MDPGDRGMNAFTALRGFRIESVSSDRCALKLLWGVDQKPLPKGRRKGKKWRTITQNECERVHKMQ